jgi:hypothetical protein
MRHHTWPFPSRASLNAGIVLAALTMLPWQASAQEENEEPRDSSQVVKDARDRQRDFEVFRQSRIPVETQPSGGSCDQRIGNICIWFGGEGEEVFPTEPQETERARRGLIGVLIEADEQVNDAWVTGHLVHYLVEHGDFGYAERVATECGIAETWWCAALLGYTLHVAGDHVGAGTAFREAFSGMPEEELEHFAAPFYIIPRDAAEDFVRQDPDEQARQWALYWRLSDPLYLVDGNDRLTDHMARWVLARNYADAQHPQMDWDEYVEETLIRYGRTIGWSRTTSPLPGMSGGRFRLQDNRRVVGHHHPNSRGYLFPEEFLESPSDIPPESWITAPREARTWYAPPYAPDFRGLETQVGRFRRGDEMLVVGAYQPAAPPVGPTGESAFGATDPYGGGSGPVESALFLIPEDGSEAVATYGSDPEGVVTLRAQPGRYVSSLEVFDREGQRAWRARQGGRQLPLTPGLVAVSDLLILKEDAPFPETMEDAIPYVRPSIRVRGDERFAVVWEVYGLRVEDQIQVTLGFTQGRPGFLARVGEFLGVLEPEDPVEVTFGDTGPGGMQTAFRAIVLELPDVEPGEYTLHLRLDLPGREPAIASRPIVVEGGA